MRAADEVIGTCHRPGCRSAAFRTRDDLSYAQEHYVWICLDGHVVPEESAAGSAA